MLCGRGWGHGGSDNRAAAVDLNDVAPRWPREFMVRRRTCNGQGSSCYWGDSGIVPIQWNLKRGHLDKQATYCIHKYHFPLKSGHLTNRDTLPIRTLFMTTLEGFTVCIYTMSRRYTSRALNKA